MILYRYIIREHIAQASDFKDQVDITVYGYTLEVKSRVSPIAARSSKDLAC